MYQKELMMRSQRHYYRGEPEHPPPPKKKEEPQVRPLFIHVCIIICIYLMIGSLYTQPYIHAHILRAVPACELAI
jgi:hypothetical protein